MSLLRSANVNTPFGGTRSDLLHSRSHTEERVLRALDEQQKPEKQDRLAARANPIAARRSYSSNANIMTSRLRLR